MGFGGLDRNMEMESGEDTQVHRIILHNLLYHLSPQSTPWQSTSHRLSLLSNNLHWTSAAFLLSHTFPPAPWMLPSFSTGSWSWSAIHHRYSAPSLTPIPQPAHKGKEPHQSKTPCKARCRQKNCCESDTSGLFCPCHTWSGALGKPQDKQNMLLLSEDL